MKEEYKPKYPPGTLVYHKYAGYLTVCSQAPEKYLYLVLNKYEPSTWCSCEDNDLLDFAAFNRLIEKISVEQLLI